MFETPQKFVDRSAEQADIERGGLASKRDVERVSAETEAVKFNAEKLMMSCANDPETAYEEAVAQGLADEAEYIKVHFINKEV